MEGLTYQQVAGFAHSWGIVYFVVLFVAVLVYAFWPSRKESFRQAASIPLHDEEVSE